MGLWIIAFLVFSVFFIKEVTSMGADYRNVLGYLPQDFGYYPNYTAMEFLMYVAALKGIPKDIAKKRANELLGLVTK